jgi:aminoglycoside phosphotransferase (APT) family kinase protein
MSGESDSQRLASWVERTLGGRVTRVEELGRWRSAWNVDVEVDGREIPLHARGDRNADHPIPVRIAEERFSNDLLEAHGIPVPHVYGLCEQPYALVMDRLPGNVDLTFAASDGERVDLMEQYLGLLRTMYGMDLAEVSAMGFDLPSGPEELALGYFMKLERIYDKVMVSPDPLVEFLRLWLHRNVPRRRDRAAFISYDAFQFMFDEGRITGLIDFEVAHVGDPLMDLGALRVRDSIKNLGDLPAVVERWAAVTGEDLDYDVIDYHTVAYNAVTVLMAAPALRAPEPTTDYMSYMAWYVNSGRWACEVLAEIFSLQLQPVEPLSPRRSSHGPAYTHLMTNLQVAGPVADGQDYRTLGLYRLARHLLRVDEVGGAVEAADADDLARLLGRRPDPAEAEAALLEIVRREDPRQDADLVWLFDRRLRRAQQLMAPPESLLIRHPRLHQLRPSDGSPLAAEPDDLPWPPGLIPGTR